MMTMMMMMMNTPDDSQMLLFQDYNSYNDSLYQTVQCMSQPVNCTVTLETLQRENKVRDQQHTCMFNNCALFNEPLVKTDLGKLEPRGPC